MYAMQKAATWKEKSIADFGESRGKGCGFIWKGQCGYDTAITTHLNIDRIYPEFNGITKFMLMLWRSGMHMNS